MSTNSKSEETPQSTYIPNAEDATEVARVMYQDRLINDVMKTLFPEDVNPSTFIRVLDIGCGTGGWITQVAHQYPKIEAIGVDISPSMLRFAKLGAQAQGLDNARFDMMDIRNPLDFPDACIDFVNARFLTGSFTLENWRALIQECKRVLRPGGFIRLTESEGFGTTSSGAWEEILDWSMEAGRKANRTFFKKGHSLGLVPMLATLLKEAEFNNIQRQAFAIDWSAGMEAHETWKQNALLFAQMGKSFLFKLGVMSEQDFEKLFQQARLDMLSDDFIALVFILSVWGQNENSSVTPK